MKRVDRQNVRSIEERRVARQGGIELRASENGPGTLVGYGVVYDEWSDDLGGFREVIRKGAGTKTLAESNDIRSAFDHGPLLGRTRSGTLKLTEDDVGIQYEVELPDTQVGRDTAEMVRRGDVWGSSFSFRTLRDRYFYEEDETRREVLEFQLYETGPVADPAYPSTSVALRSLPSLEEVAERAALEILYQRQGLTPEEIREILPAIEDVEANGRRDLEARRRRLQLAEVAI